MTKQKTTKRALLLSALSLLMCVTMFVGSTFAWFTDSVTSAGNKIQSGTLKLDLELLDKESGIWNSIKEEKTPIFNYDKWEPGYTDVKILKVENEGTLALKWYAKLVTSAKRSILEKVIDVYVCPSETELKYPADRDITGYTRVGTLEEFINSIETTTYGSLEAGESAYLGIALKMQESADNQYQDKTIGAFDIQILATQDTVEADSFGTDYDVNAEWPVIETADQWDGTADTSWYNDTATSFTLTTAEQLAGLGELVNDGTDAFAGKTIVLNSDLDLSGHNFTPIGGVDKGYAFEGTFDGKENTITGLTQNGWELGYEYGDKAGMGLFGWIYNTTIKNVNIDDAEVSMEAVVMGTVAGYATGNCTFEKVNVTNTQVANYNWDTGGIVGQVYNSEENDDGDTFTFKDINIDSSTTISGHWGTWDVSAGGVIGRTADGVNVVMEDVTVACVLDVYNDVCAAYQWYAYRYSGMLVGYTKTTETVDGRTVATAPHVTCNNVTVIYDDWANYTYCQASNVTPQYVRVQGGYSTDPYYSGRHWTAGVDANGNKMVDDNHVHADGEAHNELIVFDQLFGGGQGVYGTATHEGVTVIYNNK